MHRWPAAPKSRVANWVAADHDTGGAEPLALVVPPAPHPAKATVTDVHRPG